MVPKSSTTTGVTSPQSSAASAAMSTSKRSVKKSRTTFKSNLSRKREKTCTIRCSDEIAGSRDAAIIRIKVQLTRGMKTLPVTVLIALSPAFAGFKLRLRVMLVPVKMEAVQRLLCPGKTPTKYVSI